MFLYVLNLKEEIKTHQNGIQNYVVIKEKKDANETIINSVFKSRVYCGLQAKTPDLQWLQAKTPDLRFDQTEIMAFKVFQNFKSNFDLIIFIET